MRLGGERGRKAYQAVDTVVSIMQIFQSLYDLKGVTWAEKCHVFRDPSSGRFISNVEGNGRILQAIATFFNLMVQNQDLTNEIPRFELKDELFEEFHNIKLSQKTLINYGFLLNDPGSILN